MSVNKAQLARPCVRTRSAMGYDSGKVNLIRRVIGLD